MNWFLYDNSLRHEKVKEDSVEPFRLIYRDFDYLKHDLLIAKLTNYGFESQALNSVFSSYIKRSHRNKIKNPCSNYLKVIFDVPQYSILFNISTCGIFLEIYDVDIASYADDNTFCTYETELNIIRKLLDCTMRKSLEI